MVFVISGNRLGKVDVLAHQSHKLDAHARELEVPEREPIAPELVLLQVLQQAGVLLRGDLPVPVGVAVRVVDVVYGRSLERVVVVSVSHREPPRVGRLRIFRPCLDVEVRRALPRREQGRPPILGRLVCIMGGMLGYLWEVGLDGAEVPVDPAEEDLVHDISGHDVQIRPRHLGVHHGLDCRVFDVYLRFLVRIGAILVLQVPRGEQLTISSSILMYMTSSSM